QSDHQYEPECSGDDRETLAGRCWHGSGNQIGDHDDTERDQRRHRDFRKEKKMLQHPRSGRNVQIRVANDGEKQTGRTESEQAKPEIPSTLAVSADHPQERERSHQRAEGKKERRDSGPYGAAPVSSGDETEAAIGLAARDERYEIAEG